MTLRIFIEQLALIGALSAIVIAALWPHAKILLLPLYDKFIVSTISNRFDDNQNYLDKVGQNANKRSTQDHPRLSGRSLRRMSSEKESIMKTAYSSFPGYGQTQFAKDASILMQQKQHRHHQMSPFSGHGASGIGRDPFTQNTQSTPLGMQSMSFGFIMASVMGIMMFVLVKLLTSKMGNHNKTRTKGRTYTNGPSRLARATTTDLRQDKRKLARLSRDERARQLILHHGTKNVSRAMRFLVGELEKQKQQLLAEGTDSLCGRTTTIIESCTCYCHPDS